MFPLDSYTNIGQTKYPSLENHSIGSSKPQEPGLEDSLSQWWRRVIVKAKVITHFFKHSPLGTVTILIVYIDDIIVTSNNLKEIGELKPYLSKRIWDQRLGQSKVLLGMEVARLKKGIFISQQKYVQDLLKETGMLEWKPANTPIESNNKLRDKNEEPWLTKASTKE